MLRTANAALPPNKNGRAFLFGWAAHQTSRICGIFFAPRREIPLDAMTFLLRTANARQRRAHQNSRICGIFFALTPEISLAAVRQASGTCGAYLRFIPRKYAPYKFRASSSKNLAAAAASRALRNLSQVIYLNSSTEQKMYAVIY